MTNIRVDSVGCTFGSVNQLNRVLHNPWEGKFAVGSHGFRTKTDLDVWPFGANREVWQNVLAGKI